MPGLLQRNDELVNAPSCFCSTTASLSKSVCSNGFWSKHVNNATCNQLQKFWTELSPQARWELLRVDKQALFEQARKNMYCSRCNGLLLEGFLQIVMYGKSLQHDGAVGQIPFDRRGVPKSLSEGVLNLTSCSEDELQNQDPSVHPWGGLTTTRDGTLTLLDCYLFSKSLKTLQNVFDSARERERERELLYPDACGGGGRGWISQGMASYGRGHGTRETCALHTARLSCDTLVDFWSALGEETRHSLLKMKEEDFIERLMYRFDSKRFCRDCRRNVIREFKELKELKRMRREPHCTTWFCVADTDFQYEVSSDTVQADWSDTFGDTAGTYHHFEWAIGTAEGKSNILEFENVGMNGSAQVNDLELVSLSACYITLRAWKLDGRCIEYSAKAHALKGQQCVHSRLVVGDGFVAITRGKSIRSFFEHAEEVEEDEDDDSLDKDGNELDGECLRPQKHAKSPELAREFLLDAANVIFKEQVEKAFREGTARQNAHSIFVCLALKMLEERVHVACKEIITLEKQTKLLEEEEREKREEEERRERRRTKEREKKIRRKERLKGKEKDTEPQSNPNNPLPNPPPDPDSPLLLEEEQHLTEPQLSPQVQSSPDLKSTPSKYENDDSSCCKFTHRKDFHSHSDSSVNSSERFRNGPGARFHGENGMNGWARPMRFNPRKPGFKIQQCGCDSHSCTCFHQPPPVPSARFSRKSESIFDPSRQFYRPNQFGYRLKPKINPRNFFHTKKVWEPMESKKSENGKLPETDNPKESSTRASTPEKQHTFCRKPSEEEGANSCSSSCLSEGDSSNSNTTANMDSSSVSDSEETSLEREPPPQTNENSKGESPKKNAVPPPMHRQAQNVLFPVLQTTTSTMGLYHQIPASGLIPFPYPNPYLFGEPTPYRGLSTPVLNASHNRVYPPVCRPSVAKAGGGGKGDVEVRLFGNGESVEKGNESSNVHMVKDFSLFHFGGPVGGHKSGKERGGVLEACNVKESGMGTIEEYDLFATTNGLSFSIF